MVTVVPCPGWLVQNTSPAMSSDRRAGDRQPEPEPPADRVRAGSARKKGSNTCGRCSAAMPTPVSLTTISACSGDSRTSIRTRPASTLVLDGVGDDVGQRAQETVAISLAAGRRGCDTHGEPPRFCQGA